MPRKSPTAFDEQGQEPVCVCVLCEQPISSEDMEESQRMNPEGRAHSACYYEGLGALIEMHPIPRG